MLSVESELHVRINSRLEIVDGCWIWNGAKTRGYGKIRVSGKLLYVHRVVYELLVGEIPEGLQLDHVKDRCTSRACCNPDHLEPVTSKENTLRGDGPTATNAVKEFCDSGHLLSGHNLKIEKTGRRCRKCQQARQREYRRRNKERV